MNAITKPGVLRVFAADAIAAEEWRMQQAGDKVAAAAMKSSHEARATVERLADALQDYLDCRSIVSWSHLSPARRTELVARYHPAQGTRPVHEADAAMCAALADFRGDA